MLRVLFIMTINKQTLLQQLARWLLTAAMLGLLAACASPITTKVTSFNQWPTDTAGASFSFIRPADAMNDLEQQSYEKTIQIELEKLDLKRAALGQLGRLQVDVVTGNGTQNRTYRQPVYRDNLLYHPPYRDAAGNVFLGFWAADPFGSRYVGDRTVVRSVRVSNLRLRLLDTAGAASNAGKPRAVFESRVAYEGDVEDLATLMPFLVRAALNDFPGQSGKVVSIKFDSKTGAIITK